LHDLQSKDATKRESAAVVIQCAARCAAGRKALQGLRLAAKQARQDSAYLSLSDQEEELRLIIIVQARVRGYFARVEYSKMILQAGAFDQVFRFDVSVRRLLFGNGHKLHTMYRAYVVYPKQALDREATLQFAHHFGIMPGICSRRQFHDIIDSITAKNKNFKKGDKHVMLSFEQFLKLLVLLSMRYGTTNSDAQYDTPVHKLDGLLQIMNNSEGHKKVAKMRNSTFVKRFLLFDSEEMPAASEVAGVDLVKHFLKVKEGRTPTAANRATSRTGSSNSIDLSRKSSLKSPASRTPSMQAGDSKGPSPNKPKMTIHAERKASRTSSMRSSKSSLRSPASSRAPTSMRSGTSAAGSPAKASPPSGGSSENRSNRNLEAHRPAPVSTGTPPPAGSDSSQAQPRSATANAKARRSVAPRKTSGGGGEFQTPPPPPPADDAGEDAFFTPQTSRKDTSSGNNTGANHLKTPGASSVRSSRQRELFRTPNTSMKGNPAPSSTKPKLVSNKKGS